MIFPGLYGILNNQLIILLRNDLALNEKHGGHDKILIQITPRGKINRPCFG